MIKNNDNLFLLSNAELKKKAVDMIDQLEKVKNDLEYANYKLVRVSVNGLRGFDFHDLSRKKQEKLSIAFFGPCSILPIVDYAINNGNKVTHIAMTVDDSRQIHFTPPLEGVDNKDADANVISLPLRSVVAAGAKEISGYENEIFWPRLKTTQDAEVYFHECVEYIKDFVSSISDLLGEKPTFFLSFWEPRQNFLGALFPRYDLLNPQFFVQRLNMELEKIIRDFSNTYLIDVNDVLNSMGRFRIQDDYVRELSHASNAFDTNFEDDNKRTQHSTPVTHIYDIDGQVDVFGHCVFNIIRNNISIIRAADPIKLIIMDLDDSMWRGVLADGDRSAFERTDFWPMGLAEALLVFKARGGLLAICSKNDEELAKKEFKRVWGDRIKLEDFVSIKINFEPKSKNIQEILDEVNILPGNALFVDDNLREINEVSAIIPELRVLSKEHYDWRRAILLSPDTQVARVSQESKQRTETLKAKIVRDQSRKKMSREEWLKSLDIHQAYAIIRSDADENFHRAFELLNKTNQFNTTGKRWSSEEISKFFNEGGFIFCSFLKDKSTDNGMIGLHLVKANKIFQSILSCRVFGLCSEYASMSVLSEHLLKNYQEVVAQYLKTEKNFYCENYYTNCGFVKYGDVFILRSKVAHPDEVSSSFNIDL